MRAERLRYFLLKNRAVRRDTDDCIVRAQPDRVNLNTWTTPGRPHQNVGDWLSQIVVEHTAARFGITADAPVRGRKHLYAVGSMLLGFQDATIWGTGFLRDPTTSRAFSLYRALHRLYHKTDVRAVRGPNSKAILDRMGIPCPAVFGDPALLMPLYYQPRGDLPRREYLLIPHFNELSRHSGDPNRISTFTADWRGFLDQIAASNLVISSSLHGIVLAEAYGVPAVLLRGPGGDSFKYDDYYRSTGRTSYPCAESVEEALRLTPSIPAPGVIAALQQGLLEAFPRDLWTDKGGR